MGQSDKEQNPKLVAQTVPDRKIPLFFLFFFTPPRGTRRNFPTHRSIGPRPIFPFFFFFLRHHMTQSISPRHTAQSVPDRFLILIYFFYTTSWHRAEVLDALLKRSTQLCGQTNKKPNITVRPQWTLTKASRPTPLSRDKQETIGANSVNNFFGPQLAKQNKTGSRGNITLGNEN